MPAAVLEKEQTVTRNKRIEALDLLRGGAMVLVVIYHILYDLVYIYKIDIPRPLVPGQPEIEFVHICFLWVLFAVSGICSGYSRDPVKRGVVLYIIGWLITAVTSYIMPSQLIVFGVLSCFGACMAITSLIRPVIDKIPPYLLAVMMILLWIMFSDFHRGGIIHLGFTDITVPLPAAGDYLYPVGIKSRYFYSSDYFPVIPYIFMFITGYAVHGYVRSGRLPKWFYRSSPDALKVIGFIGRHSLIIYALHQPVLLAVFSVIIY